MNFGCFEIPVHVQVGNGRKASLASAASWLQGLTFIWVDSIHLKEKHLTPGMFFPPWPMTFNVSSSPGGFSDVSVIPGIVFTSPRFGMQFWYCWCSRYICWTFVASKVEHFAAPRFSKKFSFLCQLSKIFRPFIFFMWIQCQDCIASPSSPALLRAISKDGPIGWGVTFATVNHKMVAEKKYFLF